MLFDVLSLIFSTLILILKMMKTTDMDQREYLVRPVEKSWLKRNGIVASTTVIGFDPRALATITNSINWLLISLPGSI